MSSGTAGTGLTCDQTQGSAQAAADQKKKKRNEKKKKRLHLLASIQ